MNVVMEKSYKTNQIDLPTETLPPKSLRIALCPPEFIPFQQAMTGQPADATALVQRHIAMGLGNRGHKLTYISQRALGQNVCATDVQNPTPAPRTWSASGWFNLLSRGAWRMQQLLSVPYLNVFSNYWLFDACMQCLPGHDIVYERNGLYRTGVAMACKRLKLPYVLFVEADEVMEHDFMGTPITGMLRWRAKNMFAYNLNAANCIVCVSRPLKEHLSKKWNIPSEKMVVFPNGVDVRQFKPNPEAGANVRISLGIDDNPMLLFVGNFYEWHDVVTLLDSFTQVLVTYPNARLVLVGDGHRRQAMEQHSVDLGIDQAVHFTGLVPHAEVPGLINAADIAVAPVPASIQNMWLSPLKVFEYMATGTAVVVSRIDHLAGVIQNGQNGLLVPPGDTAALTSALGRLLGDDKLRLKLGQQAREDAAQNHSWDHYFERLERLFNSVIAGQSVSNI
jgi:glycosyltransferase involved in cell wall biosynthesis